MRTAKSSLRDRVCNSDEFRYFRFFWYVIFWYVFYVLYIKAQDKMMQRYTVTILGISNERKYCLCSLAGQCCMSIWFRCRINTPHLTCVFQCKWFWIRFIYKLCLQDLLAPKNSSKLALTRPLEISFFIWRKFYDSSYHNIQKGQF